MSSEHTVAFVLYIVSCCLLYFTVDCRRLVEVALVPVVLVVVMCLRLPVRSLFTHLDSQAMLLAVLLDSRAILICMVVAPRLVLFVVWLYTLVHS